MEQGLARLRLQNFPHGDRQAPRRSPGTPLNRDREELQAARPQPQPLEHTVGQGGASLENKRSISRLSKLESLREETQGQGHATHTVLCTQTGHRRPQEGLQLLIV